jgi:hypothetical protein
MNWLLYLALTQNIYLMKYFICTLLGILGLNLSLFGQDLEAAKAAWDEAKEMIEKHEYQKAKPKLLFVYAEMERPLTAFYLGLAYEMEEKLDSAIYYYNACIENSRKPMLKAHVKRIRVTMRNGDMQGAYKLAYDAIEQWPDNETLRMHFKDLCLWAFALDQKALNPEYLKSTALKEAYEVQTITHQELIISNIRNEKDETLLVSQRIYKGDFEIWKCHWRSSRELFEVRFNLKDRNLDRALEAQSAAAKAAYESSSNPAIRTGALLAMLPIKDKDLLEIFENEKEWSTRLCLCSEVKSSQSNKLKKACLKDENEKMQAATATMENLK